MDADGVTLLVPLPNTQTLLIRKSLLPGPDVLVKLLEVLLKVTVSGELPSILSATKPAVNFPACTDIVDIDEHPLDKSVAMIRYNPVASVIKRGVEPVKEDVCAPCGTSQL